jgi:hypothetical protein
VDNLGDWLIRVQHDLFREMLGPEADAILFLPMMEFAELFRDELARIANSRQVVFGIKENVSADQSASGQEPYQRTTEPSSFWLYCPACFRRSRATWVPGATVNHNCGSCGDRRELTDPEIWRWLMPDIVAYEAGAFRMGIGGWVTGSRAPYHPVIEHLYRELYGIEMPPKFFVRSIPTFQGIGEPPEGYRKTRLLRAWLESTPSALAAALRAPWDENPAIRSDLLPAP